MKDVKISDYLWFQEGPGVRNTQYTTSGVKLINVANLVDGNVDLSTSDRYISEEEAYGKYNHFLADDGDFVIASSGIKIDYFDKKMGFIKKEHLPLCMNTSCIRFKVLDTNNLEIKYFMYYLKSNSFKKQLFNQITGSAQLNFGPSHLKKMTFPLIELKEQKRIIERLDKTQNIINETKSLLSKYDTLIKSRFIEMFGDPYSNPMGWERKTFKQVAIRLSDGPFGSNLKSEHYSTSGIRVIRLGNIGVNEFLDNDKAFIPFSHYETLRKYTCKAGEIVIGTMGVPNLRACIIPEEIEVSINKADCVHYIPKPELLDTRYVCQYINCPETLLLASGMIHGQTRTRVSSGQIAEMPISIPPLQLQKQFSSFVQQIDKSKFAVQKSLEKAETLYKSLMQEYFG